MNMANELPPVGDVRTPIGQAMAECEVYCVAACCGMDAYDVRAEHLRRWADRISRATFEEVKGQVDRAVEEIPFGPESIYFLDGEHGRAEVLDWFRRVRVALAEVGASA
jgi:hypothetical protein